MAAKLSKKRVPVERKINSLIEDIIEYFNNKGIVLEEPETYFILTNFLKKNIYLVIRFINPENENTEEAENIPSEQNRMILEYIRSAEQKRPDYFKVLEEMLYGVIVSIVLCVKESSDIANLNCKFKKCRIYLDSNYLFSLFDLHPEEFVIPARELLYILKSENFDIRVLDITIDELVGYLKYYKEDKIRHPDNFRIDSIFSILRQKGWTEAKVNSFISEIERHLSDLGIKVEYSNFNLKNYESGQVQKVL